MSLFQCDNCGCVENTALAWQGFSNGWEEEFDWTGLEHLEGKQLCSACGPSKFIDGDDSGKGKWHGEFSRVYLVKGDWFTNEKGNLEHKETGSEDYMSYVHPLMSTEVKQGDNND